MACEDGTKDVEAGGVSKKKQIKSSRLCMKVEERKIEERTATLKHDPVRVVAEKSRSTTSVARHSIMLVSGGSSCARASRLLSIQRSNFNFLLPSPCRRSQPFQTKESSAFCNDSIMF